MVKYSLLDTLDGFWSHLAAAVIETYACMCWNMKYPTLFRDFLTTYIEL